MPKLWVVRNQYEGPGRSLTYVSDLTCIYLKYRFSSVEVVDVRRPSTTFYLDRFLDTSTNVWQSLLDLPLKSSDVLFFLSTEFLWGLDLFLETLKLKNIKVYTLGVWSNSVLIPGDLIGRNTLFVEQEHKIFDSLDYNLTSSKHVANLLCRPEECVVSGLPSETFDLTLIKYYERDNVLVFPHRLDYSKNILFFKRLCEKLKDIVTVRYLNPNPLRHDLVPLISEHAEYKVCPTQEDYIEELCRAKIIFSCSILESYGFSMIEGIKCGCIPVAPTFGVYKEYIDSDFLYDYEWIEQGSYEMVAEFVGECLNSTYDSEVPLLGDRALEIYGHYCELLLNKNLIG